MKIETFSRNGCFFALLLDEKERVLSGGVFHTDEDAQAAALMTAGALVRCGVAVSAHPTFCRNEPQTLQEYLSDIADCERELQRDCGKWDAK